MGEIVLSTSSARLEAMPSAPIRQVRIPNRQVRGNDYKAEKIASGQVIAKGVQDLARAGMNIALSLEHDRRVAEDSEVEAAYEKHLRESFMGVDGKEGVIARVAGAQKMADLDQFVKEGGELLTEKAAKEFLADRNYSRQNRDMMLQRFARISRPYQMHLQAGILNKSKEIKIAGLDNNFNQKLESWRAIGGDAGEVLDAFAQSQEERGTPEEKVAADTIKTARTMAVDHAIKEYGFIDTEKGIDTALKALEENPTDILYGNAEGLKQYFSTGEALFSPEVKKSLKHVLEVRRGEIQDQKKVDVEKIASPGFESANTIWDPEDPTKPNVNRLAGVEEAIKGLDQILGAKDDQGDLIYADGSTPRNIALERRNKLNEFADNIAAEELMTKLVEKYKEDPKSSPKIYDFEKKELAKDILPGSRQAHLAEKVQDAFEKVYTPIRTEEHKSKLADLKLEAIAGASNPAAYKKKIFDAAMNNEISVPEWQELSASFVKNWAKDPRGTISRKQLFAQKALVAIQNEFGGEVTSAYKYNQSKGDLDYIKDSKYGGLKYSRRIYPDPSLADPRQQVAIAGDLVFGVGPMGLMNTGRRLLTEKFATTNVELSAAQVEELAEWATELSRWDGEILDKDPITLSTETDYFGRKIEKGKPFDAADYFKLYLKKMKDDVFVQKNFDYIDQLTDAVIRLQTEEAVGLEEARRQLEANREKQTKNVTVKKPNVKNTVGVVPSK